jgi:hypothetical protein
MKRSSRRLLLNLVSAGFWQGTDTMEANTGDSVMMKAIVSVACGVIVASFIATGASAQVTLASVKQKGFLTCGASSGSIGFGMPDA